MKAQNGTETLRLEFTNLPLIESTVRLTIPEPINLTFKLIADLASRVQQKFPIVSEPSQWIEPAPGIQQSIAMTPQTIHGVVYEGHALGLTATLHNHVIVVKWRRSAIHPELDYPRFARLREAAWQIVDAIGELGHELGVRVVNMSYTNFVPVPTGSAILDYFRPEAQLDLAKSAEKLHKIEVSWRESGGVDLRFLLQSTTMDEGGEKTSGFNLTTVGGHGFEDPSQARVELDAVHRRLQSFFLDLLSDRALREWGFKGK